MLTCCWGFVFVGWDISLLRFSYCFRNMKLQDLFVLEAVEKIKDQNDRDRERERETDRDRDRQTDRQKQADRQRERERTLSVNKKTKTRMTAGVLKQDANT